MKALSELKLEGAISLIQEHIDKCHGGSTIRDLVSAQDLIREAIVDSKKEAK